MLVKNDWERVRKIFERWQSCGDIEREREWFISKIKIKTQNKYYTVFTNYLITDQPAEMPKGDSP